MVDGHGHVVSLAQDCGTRNAVSKTGGPLDDSMSEAVDNVVEAIYRRAKKEREGIGAANMREDEEKKQEDPHDNNKKRKRELEEADLS